MFLVYYIFGKQKSRGSVERGIVDASSILQRHFFIYLYIYRERSVNAS